MKNPRGILNYDVTGHNMTDITWKMTGNLGGEDYMDRTRGPLNEGSSTEGTMYVLQVLPTQEAPIWRFGWKSSGSFKRRPYVEILVPNFVSHPFEISTSLLTLYPQI
jgi:beta-galactosidase